MASRTRALSPLSGDELWSLELSGLELSPLERDIILTTAIYPPDVGCRILKLSQYGLNPTPPSPLESFQSAPTHHLGAMKSLPPELLTDIIRELDIFSCLSLAQTNRYARQIVHSVPAFTAVVTHAWAFCVITRQIGLREHFTIVDVDRLLRQHDCRECGRTAPYVFLPAAARCCPKCLERRGCWPENDIASVSAMARSFQTSPARLRRFVPTMRTTPGCHPFARAKPVSLVSVQRSIDAFTPVRRISHCDALFKRARGMASKDRDWKYMATALLPCIDRQTGNELPIMYCGGCQNLFHSTDWFRSTKYVAYTPQRFLEHFRCCDPASEIFVKEGPGNRVINSRSLWNGGWAGKEAFMVA